ncbi:MAG: DNA-protecting protein DprA [Amylibacter sp.]
MDTPDPIAPFRPCHVPSVDAPPWLCRSGTSGYYETGRYKNYSPYSFVTGEAEFLEAQHKGYHPICISAPDYPVFLAEISDAPPLLWANGNNACLNKPIIAPVGAHSASSLRRRVTHMMVEGLAEVDFSVISGLAHSIDAAATLKHGTIAVVAGGLDVFYPRENKKLYRIYHDIPENGILLTDQPAGLIHQARHFPMRNRIIAGMAKAVVIMEGAARYGSLITAHNALDIAPRSWQ